MHSCRTFFCVAVFPCCTFFAFFSCCTFFELGFFHVAPIFFSISSIVALFSCCNFFMLHFFGFGPSLFPWSLSYSFHGAPFFYCFFFSSHFTLFTLHFSCHTHFMLHIFPAPHFASCTFCIIHFLKA